MNARGAGVAQDDAAAVEWYRKAAEKGEATAEYNLCFCYEMGPGVQKDLATAVAWYKKAAAQGFGPATPRTTIAHATPISQVDFRVAGTAAYYKESGPFSRTGPGLGNGRDKSRH